MNNEFGEKAYPVWLLSEIELSFWEQKLNGPFDYRLPMRHVICTSVFNKIQETVYRIDKRRVDTERFYIRNTLPANLDKPNINDVIWEENILKDLDRLKKDIEAYRPKVILAFGAFTYESLRRVHNQSPSRSFGSWTPAELGDAFRKNLDLFDINKSNFFPFLDRTISGWKFLESHDDFEGKPGGDYFSYVGAQLGRKFIEHKDELKIWIE